MSATALRLSSEVSPTDERAAIRLQDLASVGLPKQGPTTASYWLQGDANPLARHGADGPFPSEGSEDVDVVVIGSGITGISVVHHLVRGVTKEAVVKGLGKMKIVILEARDFCSGATGRNGGHFLTLPYDNFTPRSARSPAGGPDEGVLAVELEMRTVVAIRALIATQGWADAVHLGTHDHTRLFFTDEEEEDDCVEYDAARRAGVPWQGVRRMTSQEMARECGAAFPGITIPAGSLWPVKLVTKLFELAVAEAEAAPVDVRVRLYTHTPVEAVEPLTTVATEARWAVRTPRGTLKTRFVVHASNAWAAHLLPQFSMPMPSPKRAESSADMGVGEKCLPPPPRRRWIAPYREQIIATRAKVLPRNLPRRGFAANSMAYYWIPEPVHGLDDSKNALVILGGGPPLPLSSPSQPEMSDDTTLDPHLSASLRTILPLAFPQFFEEDAKPEMEWSGIMSVTDTEDPIVGPVPNSASGEDDDAYLPGQYIAAGYNGHGMSRAYSCAEAVVQMVLQEMRTEEGRRPQWQRPDWLPASFTTLPTSAAQGHENGSR